MTADEIQDLVRGQAKDWLLAGAQWWNQQFF